MKNIFIKTNILILLFLNSNLCYNQSIVIHDPVIIKQDSLFYVFATGWGISKYSSIDLSTWKKEKSVFDKPPTWALETISGFKGHIWAPDISYYKGRYYLFYSVSVFGKNTSCIGLASNKTLHADNPEYKWIDHGKIIQSIPNRDMWNAIDPNLIIDEDSIPWLTFGSFWNGIKLVQLKKDLTGLAYPEKWHTIARRNRTFEINDSLPGDGAIEAPFIYKKNNYYFLFVSFDYCCKGINSNYKIVVGRSKKVTGPYIDEDGLPMDKGGGTIVVQGNKNYSGVGHNAVFNYNNEDYLIFHGYDINDNGKSKLIIKKIQWINDWPKIYLE